MIRLRRGLARGSTTLLVLAALVATAATAAAHENQDVAQGRHLVPAGGAVEFPATIHYHRLAGEVRVAGEPGPGAGIVVSVVGPERTSVVAGPGAALRVNALVACCDDASWTRHVVRLENVGPRAVHVDVRLAFLHDGFAVAGEDAETGAAASMLLFAAAPAAFGLAAFRRDARPDGGTAARWIAASLAALGAMWLLAGILAVPSMRAYGGGVASGLVASAAHLPWVGNAFLTTVDLLTLALLALWIASFAAWVGAARRAPASRRVAGLAAVLAIGALGASLAWALDYSLWAVPMLAGVVAAALPAGWLVRRLGAPS